MSAGTYEQVGSGSDVSFQDPTGAHGDALNTSQSQMTDWNQQMASQLANMERALQNAQGYRDQASTYDPNAYMAQFMGQAAGLQDLAQGATSPLQKSLNAIAQRQARLGGEAALAAMPGMVGSGAGMAAYGQAYADPFAQAQAQTQASQLDLTKSLWDRAMGANAEGQQYRAGLMSDLATQLVQQGGVYAQNAGNYGNMAANALNTYGGLASGMSTMYQPTYEYRPGLADRLWDLGGQVAGGAAGGATSFLLGKL